MKKILFIILAIISYALNLSIIPGWQLKGTNQELNISVFNNPNIISVWTYDSQNKKWKAYFPNKNINYFKYKIENLNKIDKYEGFWIYSSANLTLNIDSNQTKNINAKSYVIDNKNIANIKKICSIAKGGDTIYLKGGVYKDNFPMIRCEGKLNNPIIITAYPGEKVIIRNSWIIKGNNLIIKNLNFRGYSDEINLSDVMKHWFNEPKEYTKIGVLIKGNHILFENNTIGYYPGAGLKVTDNSDYVTVTHNIVYNNAWYSIGGTGGLIVKDIIADDNSTQDKIKILNNLIFGNEERVISHVFSKGFTKMVIDEGEGVLIQQEDDATNQNAKAGNYNGRFLVQNNLILYNGKGVSLNKANKIDFIENALYGNGTIQSNPKATGVILNHSSKDKLIKNLIECDKNGYAFSILQGSENNYFKDNYIKCSQKENIAGVNIVNSLFRDPKNLDFYNNYSYDKFNNILSSFDSMIKENNINVKPTNFKVDLNYEIATIIKEIPKKDDTQIIYDQKNNQIKVYNIDNSNIPGMPNNFIFELPKNYKLDNDLYQYIDSVE